ncbi:hypothetical protein [Leptospira alexanderi]|uniref:hypothetical protein n=1 Tax=Leptospira alexanderi TaxID=100053 RepID=UPI000990C92D|nr:hypothetical protein [Leptospira alexanderi]
MNKHKFTKKEIQVTDDFIQMMSELYIKHRSETRFDFREIDQNLLFLKHGFKAELLEEIITRNSVANDIKRDAGKQPAILNDIYRSDLGELLLTTYFEDLLPTGERFKIPSKNITNRELASQPGRGIDAIGYRERSDKIEVLISEAKVSSHKKNPPDVVDYNKDSIYETQKKFKENKEYLIGRLSDHCKKLSAEDASKLGLAILFMQYDKSDKFDLVFGCSLVRDISCIKINEDYGKLYTQRTDFDPYQISFCIMNFDKDIDKTVDLFYKKVQELCHNPK